ncbi:MAG TPA: hypothetical protein VKE98_23685, partial [Gemmataceae bacterium]|nr:hypothetical protein [Gemmataceae bacterium]
MKADDAKENPAEICEANVEQAMNGPAKAGSQSAVGSPQEQSAEGPRLRTADCQRPTAKSDDPKAQPKVETRPAPAIECKIHLVHIRNVGVN